MKNFWYKEVSENKDPKAILMILGNKCDLTDIKITKIEI